VTRTTHKFRKPAEIAGLSAGLHNLAALDHDLDTLERRVIRQRTVSDRDQVASGSGRSRARLSARNRRTGSRGRTHPFVKPEGCSDAPQLAADPGEPCGAGGAPGA
jgi:hypothetical protein